MRSTEWKVGVLVLAAAGLLLGFLAILGGLSLRGGERLRVRFDYSGNLQAGAPVKVSGINVGKVDEVRFLGGQIDDKTGERVYVEVVAFVENRVKDTLRADAAFFVNTQGVLGEQYLEIKPGSFAQPPLDWSRPHRGVDPPRTDLIVARLYDFLDSITTLLKDDKDVIRDFLRSGSSVVRTLDELLKDNRGEIKSLLTHADELTREAAALVGSLRRGVGDASQVKRTLDHVEALAAAVRREVDPLLQRAKKALEGLEGLTSVIGPGERERLKQALDDLVSVSRKAERLATDAQALVADVRKGKGTAGALIVDQQIYDDLKELVRDLKRNPWKFFWKE